MYMIRRIFVAYVLRATTVPSDPVLAAVELGPLRVV